MRALVSTPDGPQPAEIREVEPPAPAPDEVYQSGVETFGRDLGLLARLMGEGRLQPQIGLALSWRELGRAMAALRDRQVNGKVVLTLD